MGEHRSLDAELRGRRADKEREAAQSARTMFPPPQPSTTSENRWNTSAKVAPTSTRSTADSVGSGRNDNTRFPSPVKSPLATDSRGRNPVTSQTDTWRTESS